VRLVYSLSGQINPEHAKEAVAKSMSLFCGVSAMIAKETPISYEIQVNGSLGNEFPSIL
jgi:uncharacterized OsmC-like protein